MLNKIRFDDKLFHISYDVHFPHLFLGAHYPGSVLSYKGNVHREPTRTIWSFLVFYEHHLTSLFSFQFPKWCVMVSYTNHMYKPLKMVNKQIENWFLELSISKAVIA